MGIFKKLAATGASIVTSLAVMVAPVAAAPAFSLEPFVFVGTEEQCGGVAGSDIVTAEWDDSTGNPSPAILLQKDGLTSDCSSAGVDIITSLEGGPVSALTELNYDYRNDGHCGAGAPRFNIVTDEGTLFLGCSAAPQSDTIDEDWTHVEYGTDELEAAFTAANIDPSATITNIYILFDEGTDTPIGGTIGTAGTVYIDNISVNGDVVGDPEPEMPANKDECKKGGWQSFGVFKNQGDCVSFVASNGRNPATGLANF